MNYNDGFQYMRYGLPGDIQQRKLHGDFSGAIRLIDRYLADVCLSEGMRRNLQIQKLICEILPGEFPYSKEDALALVQEYIPGFTGKELEDLMDQRHIRWIYVDGKVRIFNRFFASLCKAAPGFGLRAGVKLPGVESAAAGSSGDSLLDAAMRKMQAQGSMACRIRIRASVRLKDTCFFPGIHVRAHLPIPASCSQQDEIRIEQVWPESGMLSPPDAPQRTVCWEEQLLENQSFTVEYSYLHRAVYTDAYQGSGIPGSYDFDLQEQEPHIVFSPYIRSLCQELTEGITDPLTKARAFYDYITLGMHYTYMPNYLVLEDIAENCARSKTGDCGVLALLFLTLCRCAGIPAQWQSGLTAEPDFIGGHDWVRFYVEPYGWLFADPSYGTGAVRAGNEERRKFYFGNLDPYRMVANSAFYSPFTIPKQHLRADPYDNQLGEIESSERGFLFDAYERSKEVLMCQEI